MKVYITFGQIHTHSINGKTVDKDCVAAIECETFDQGRKMAMEWFDGKFHESLTVERITEDLMSYYPRGIIEVN